MRQRLLWTARRSENMKTGTNKSVAAWGLDWRESQTPGAWILATLHSLVSGWFHCRYSCKPSLPEQFFLNFECHVTRDGRTYHSPRTAHALNETKCFFPQLLPSPHITGAMDCTHVQLEREHVYRNCTQTHSVMCENCVRLERGHYPGAAHLGNRGFFYF